MQELAQGDDDRVERPDGADQLDGVLVHLYSGSSPGVRVIARSSPSRTTVAFSRRADALDGHHPLQVVGALQADAVELDEQVLGAQAREVGRASRPRPR